MPITSTTAPSDSDLRARIVGAARELFLERGYSQVSTIEIAEALGMSKKTLYREFETKEDILRACVIPRLQESSKRIDAILDDRAMPFPDKLQAIMDVFSGQHQRVSHVLARDVSIHAPEMWREIQEHKRARLKKFERLLEEGIERGYFRSDIPGEVIVRMHTAAVEALMTPQALSELPCTAHEVFQNIVSILLEGILREGKRKPFLSTNPHKLQAKRIRTAH